MATEVGSGVLGSVNQSGTRLGDRRTTTGRNLLNSRNATVNDVVASQEESTRVLREINEKLESLGGSREGSSPFANLFNDNESNNGPQSGGVSLDADSLRGIGEAVSEGSDNSAVWSRIAGNTEGMSGSIKGMSGSMGGAIAVLQVINKVLEAIRGVLGAINDTVQRGIDQSITNQKNYLGPISSRLQTFTNDSAQSYKDLSYNIRNVFTNSRYVNQQEMLKNLNSLVERGIGYNLEDRAYLMTIADRTVATFDLLDGNLNRMIRLQQADLSRTQMGLEAQLTKFLNSNFQDTSYLSNMYDNITGSLLEATSQMSYDETTSYLYNVQKWLASLYSVGMSENAINQIAQGLNLLGSGNVSQLTGNDQLNTLFAMSAQRAGLSYAQLLTTGVSDENVDKLLRSMIEYLQSIAENTSSEVLRNEYGRIFGGLSVSDLRAIQNLTLADVSNIDTSNLTLENALKETGDQIRNISKRTSIAEQVENMFGNIIYSVGAQIAENEDIYKYWVNANIAEELGDMVGSVIPGIFGSLLKNGVGVITEGLKSTYVGKAISGDEQMGIRGLNMFRNYEYEEFEDLTYNLMDEGEEALENASNALEVDAANKRMLAGYYMDSQRPKQALKAAVDNWEVFSQVGAIDALGFMNPNTFFPVGDRANNYTSNITLAEQAWEESESQIKAATEEITGVDDSITQSIDDLYDGLFGSDSRPIKVMLVDIDGNILASTNTNQYSSNFDVEEDIGVGIFGQRYYAAGIQ